MLNFLIIAVSLVLGILLRKSKMLPESTPHILNRYVILVALPVTIIFTVPFMPLDLGQLIPASMPWFEFVLGVGFFTMLRRMLNAERGQTGALMLTGSLGNTSFVGFPMITAMMGRNALGTAIMIDQAGSFLVVSTLGLITALAFSGGELSGGAITRRIIGFPPFIALVIAILLFFVPGVIYFMILLRGVAKVITWTLGPAALLAVGYQLRFDMVSLRKHKQLLIPGLAFKLLIAPAIVALVYALLPMQHEEWIVTVLEAGMAPMITAAIIANEHGLDAELTSLMVGIGIPLSILTVPLWFWLLN